MEHKSFLATYREKMKEPHTQEEIARAFDEGFALCFAVRKSAAPTKAKLITAICEVAPDVIVTTADLCSFGVEPTIARDQLLLIHNGDKETANKLVAFLEQSGAVDSALVVMSEKKNGIKRCYRYVVGNDEPAPIKKANLLIDGDKLLLTVRTHIKGTTKQTTT